MLRVAAAIALHFTVSLTLLRVVALEILTTCKAQNMDLHHSFEPLLSLSVPTNSVTVAIPFSNPQTPGTAEFGAEILLCGRHQSLKIKLTGHNVYKVTTTH